MDRTKSMGSEWRIQAGNEDGQNTLDSMIVARRKNSDRNKLIQGRTMYHTIVRMLVAVMRMMILCRNGESKAVMGVGSKINSLAAGPGRGNAGEKYQEGTSDEDQPFHVAAVKTLPYGKRFFKRSHKPATLPACPKKPRAVRRVCQQPGGGFD